jgi:hypothetical protein
MLSKISFACASAVVATELSVPSFAREKTNTAHTATVTGCLAQGDEPNEYAIKTEAIGPTTQRIAAVRLIRTGPLRIGSEAALAVIAFRNVRPVPGNNFLGRVET